MDKLDEWMNRAIDSNEPPKPVEPQVKPLVQQKQNFQQRPQGQHPQRPPQARPQGQPQNNGGFQKRPPQGQPQQARPANGQQSQQNRQRNGGQQQPNNNRPQFNRNHNRPPSGPRRPLPKMDKPKQASPILPNKLKIIPLGGLNEVGKNMMALEFENDIIIIDVGLQFPEDDMLGVDYVIPDVSYLEENKKRIRGIVITHGHLDHIGGLPYIMPKLDFPPVYGTRLTIGLIRKKAEEFKQDKLAKLITIDPAEIIKLGQFTCSFFRVAHSIPDSVGVVVDTPIGKVVHTGDFKFDETPARNISLAEIDKMEALGHQNVLALFCESTNALKPGHSMSEKEVGDALEGIIRTSPNRLIIASFSSQIGRVQQILDAAVKHQKKIYISGRSMRENIEICAKLGYLTFPKNLLFDIKKYKDVPDNEALILTTGSQGEDISSLTRIANGEHPQVKVKKGDTIVLSSSPIVGNEKAIFALINNLTMLGADVIHNQIADVHTSGHGKQDELVRMVNYIKPKFLVPVHGEYYMRQGLSKIAQERCGMKENQVIMLKNGDVLIGENNNMYKSSETVDTKYILIDGLGEGQAGSQVQVDREIMSKNGALAVLVYVNHKTRKLTRQPDVVSRGFIYMHETDEITREISILAEDAYRRITEKNPGADRKDVKKYIRQSIDKFTHDKLGRIPLIVPLIIEV
ncbi:MAG: RNase J family beta-CASP ribonuclease [Patescibacteria group bacterium]